MTEPFIYKKSMKFINDMKIFGDLYEKHILESIEKNSDRWSKEIE